MTTFEFINALMLGLPLVALGIFFMIMSVKGLLEARKELKAMEGKRK